MNRYTKLEDIFIICYRKLLNILRCSRWVIIRNGIIFAKKWLVCFKNQWVQYMHITVVWVSCQIRKNAGCAFAGNAGNVFPATALTSGFLWGRWRGKRFRYPRRMPNAQFYVSGKRSRVPHEFTNIFQDNFDCTKLPHLNPSNLKDTGKHITWILYERIIKPEQTHNSLHILCYIFSGEFI